MLRDEARGQHITRGPLKLIPPRIKNKILPGDRQTPASLQVPAKYISLQKHVRYGALQVSQMSISAGARYRVLGTVCFEKYRNSCKIDKK